MNRAPALFTLKTSLFLAGVLAVSTAFSALLFGTVWLWQERGSAETPIGREVHASADTLALDRWRDLYRLHVPTAMPRVPHEPVAGEDPPGWPSTSALVRTRYARDAGHEAIEYRGRVAKPDALRQVREGLLAAGYTERVLRADAYVTKVEFNGPRSLVLTLKARGPGVVVRVEEAPPGWHRVDA